jgi:hypothetical protein
MATDYSQQANDLANTFTSAPSLGMGLVAAEGEFWRPRLPADPASFERPPSASSYDELNEVDDYLNYEHRLPQSPYSSASDSYTGSSWSNSSRGSASPAPSHYGYQFQDHLFGGVGSLQLSGDHASAEVHPAGFDPHVFSSPPPPSAGQIQDWRSHVPARGSRSRGIEVGRDDAATDDPDWVPTVSPTKSRGKARRSPTGSIRSTGSGPRGGRNDTVRGRPAELDADTVRGVVGANKRVRPSIFPSDPNVIDEGASPSSASPSAMRQPCKLRGRRATRAEALGVTVAYGRTVMPDGGWPEAYVAWFRGTSGKQDHPAPAWVCVMLCPLCERVPADSVTQLRGLRLALPSSRAPPSPSQVGYRGRSQECVGVRCLIRSIAANPARTEYSCKHCTSNFVRGDNLTQHIRNIHGDAALVAHKAEKARRAGKPMLS